MKFNLHEAADRLLREVKKLDNTIENLDLKVDVGTSREKKHWHIYAWKDGDIIYSSKLQYTYAEARHALIGEIESEGGKKDEQVFINPDKD
jgi:hypothetical protein